MSERPGQPATITGVGVVSPAGSSVDEAWSMIRAGAATCGEVITHPELPDVPVVACLASGFTPETVLERHELRRLDRTHQMSFWAADQALASAGDGPDPSRCAIVVGTGLGVEFFPLQQWALFNERGFRAISPLTIPVSMVNSVAGHLSIRYGYTGPSLTISTACASGANALGEALWMLRSGRADRVLVGAVDSGHSPRITGPFTRMEAMSSRFDDPTGASRPFSADRDGFAIAEGAAFFVLDRSSETSGFGRLLGYGATADAHHIVAPSPHGTGAAACMRAALDDAGLPPDEVGHVNAHGTSTLLNDQAEAEAIAEVFGAGGLPVTSNKGVTGHMIAASGAFEALMTLCALRDSSVPPTANFNSPDDAIAPLIDVSSSSQTPRSDIAISNSFGFGGHNASLLLSR